MDTKRNITLTAIAFLVFAGCSAPPEGSPEPQTSASDISSDISTAPTTEESAEASDTESDPNTLNVSLNGDTEEIAFTEVYCSGSSGDIQNMIGKVNNQPPLLKVSGSDRVMLKMGHEQPYTAQVSDGLAIDDESATFDEVSVSGAVIEGTMTCTSWD